MSNNRNAPCPCGSGRKFKHCCFGKREPVTAEKPRRNFKGIYGWLAVVVISPAIALFVWRQIPPEPEVADAPPMRILGEGNATTPRPYHHDRANNRHWDPGHGHWHDGPPPALSAQTQTQTVEPETTPEPFYYDAANNRHWDPGHDHWHDGPPPEGASVNVGTE